MEDGTHAATKIKFFLRLLLPSSRISRQPRTYSTWFLLFSFLFFFYRCSTKVSKSLRRLACDPRLPLATSKMHLLHFFRLHPSIVYATITSGTTSLPLWSQAAALLLKRNRRSYILCCWHPNSIVNPPLPIFHLPTSRVYLSKPFFQCPIYQYVYIYRVYTYTHTYGLVDTDTHIKQSSLGHAHISYRSDLIGTRPVLFSVVHHSTVYWVGYD